MDERIESKLEALSKKSKVPLAKIKEIYNQKIKEIQSNYVLSTTDEKDLALMQVYAYLKKLLFSNGTTYKVIFIAQDGDPVDWAKIEKARINAKIAELGKEAVIKMGYIKEVIDPVTKETTLKYYYTENAPMFKRNREIEDHDVLYHFISIIIDENSNPQLAKILVKDSKIADSINENLLKITYSTLIRSKKKQNEFYLDKPPEFLSETILSDFLYKFFKKYDYPFEKIVEMAENPILSRNDKLVFLNGYPVISINENVGNKMSTVIRLSTPEFEKYYQLVVWLKNRNTDAIEGIPYNVFGTITRVDHERKAIIINGIYGWTDPKYKPKVLPKEISIDEGD